MCGSRWRWPEVTQFPTGVETVSAKNKSRSLGETHGCGIGGSGEGSFKTLSKGRPRKPLAEVILWSAPLRATSSVRVKAGGVPLDKSLKTKADRFL
jgi:hypothetical protein